MMLFKVSKLKIVMLSLLFMVSVAVASERQLEIYDAAFDAIKNNDIEAIRSLVGEGLDPNYILGDPKNLMRVSVTYEKPEMLKELIIAGGNVDHKLKGNMYFATYVAKKKDMELLKPVLAQNPDLNGLMYVDQYTAFTGMLRFIKEEALRYVINNSNADVNFRPEKGLSPLYHAYERGECGLKCVELLLEVGADPCLEIGPSGESFVSYVDAQEDVDLMKKLKPYECDKDV